MVYCHILIPVYGFMLLWMAIPPFPSPSEFSPHDDFSYSWLLILLQVLLLLLLLVFLLFSVAMHLKGFLNITLPYACVDCLAIKLFCAICPSVEYVGDHFFFGGGVLPRSWTHSKKSEHICGSHLWKIDKIYVERNEEQILITSSTRYQTSFSYLEGLKEYHGISSFLVALFGKMDHNHVWNTETGKKTETKQTQTQTLTT